MSRTNRPSRRSFVIIAVLVIVGSALLVATSLLFLIQAEAAAASSAAGSAQARALAWSGVQAVMQRLDEQRDVILDGETPRLDEEYVIYETAARTGVVRLLPVGAAGDLLAPEAARLDLNTATAAELAKTGLVEESLAEAITTYRDGAGRPLQSVEELLRIPGVTPSILYGPIEEIALLDHAMGVTGTLAERVDARLSDNVPRGLADVLTVFSIEPPLQRSGDLRINLNTTWSEELGERVADRFGEDAAQQLERLFKSGATFESDGDICRTLRTGGAALENWSQPVDAFTAESGDYLFGRLDINTAPYETLVALPGITPEQASEIVRRREDLAADDRASIVWPALEGILEPEAYDDLAGRITTRSWVYRLRLAAGEVATDDPDGPLIGPVIYEVVIDLCDPRPRIAALRDVSLLETAAMIAAAAPLRDAIDDLDRFTDEDPEDDGVAPESDDDVVAPAPDGYVVESEADEDGNFVIRRDPAAGEGGDPFGFDPPGAGPPAATPSTDEGGKSSSGSRSRRRLGRWRSG